MRRLVTILLAALGALLASQVPEFAQQYRQRLGGAIDELTREGAAFDADARREGLDRPAALNRLAINADPVARARGERAAETFARRDRLATQREAFLAAGPFARVGALLGAPDPGLARATLADYEPAMPTTTEGIVTAGVGGLAGLMLGGVLSGASRLARRRRRRAVAAT